MRLQAGALCVEREGDGGAVVERREELRLHRVDVREVVAGQPLREVDVEDGLVVPRLRRDDKGAQHARPPREWRQPQLAFRERAW